jgi:nitroreductase
MIHTNGISNRRTFMSMCAALGGWLFTGAAARAAEASVPAAAPANETLRTIHSLHSTHGDFSERAVSDADLDTILAATVRAANASNSQSYSIVVSRDSDKIQKLTTYRASCLLLYCADETRLTDTAKYLGYESFPGTAGEFVWSSTNAILAAQTAVIAARSLGIDSLTTNGIHRGDMERVWEILELPRQGCFPLIALLLGYGRSTPAVKHGRLEGKGVVHREKYQRLSKDELKELVRTYDDPNRHLWLAQFGEHWKEQGYQHYLDWYYKKWEGQNGPPTGESQLLRLLKRSGYLNA